MHLSNYSFQEFCAQCEECDRGNACKCERERESASERERKRRQQKEKKRGGRAADPGRERRKKRKNAREETACSRVGPASGRRCPAGEKQEEEKEDPGRPPRARREEEEEEEEKKKKKKKKKKRREGRNKKTKTAAFSPVNQRKGQRKAPNTLIQTTPPQVTGLMPNNPPRNAL